MEPNYNPWDFFVTRKPAITPVGLTKRELFAALAMQGLLAYPEEVEFNSVSKTAVMHADALIAELSKPTE